MKAQVYIVLEFEYFEGLHMGTRVHSVHMSEKLAKMIALKLSMYSENKEFGVIKKSITRASKEETGKWIGRVLESYLSLGMGIVFKHLFKKRQTITVAKVEPKEKM